MSPITIDKFPFNDRLLLMFTELSIGGCRYPKRVSTVASASNNKNNVYYDGTPWRLSLSPYTPFNATVLTSYCKL